MPLVQSGDHRHGADHVQLLPDEVKNVELVPSLADHSAHHVVTLLSIGKGTVNAKHDSLEFREISIPAVILPPVRAKHVTTLGCWPLLIQRSKVPRSNGFTDSLQGICVVTLGAERLAQFSTPVRNSGTVSGEDGPVGLVFVEGRKVNNSPVFTAFFRYVVFVFEQLSDHVVLRPSGLNDHDSTHMGLKTSVQGGGVPVIELLHHAA